MKIRFFILIWLLASSISSAQSTQKISKPEKDFEKFWSTFRDNYAFFKLKKINWDSIYTKYRPMVSKKTKEKELISIFGQMVTPLKDGHITISKGDEVVFKVKKSSYFRDEFKGIENEFWQTVATTLKNNNFSDLNKVGPIFKSEPLYYTSHTEDLAYIRITRCFGNPESLFDDNLEKTDLTLMLQKFDSIISSYSTKKGLILDLRSNGGGHGGLELASRLTANKTLTHYKATRIGGGYDQFSELIAQYIEPNTAVQFIKPIVVLTSDKTASSAEDITLSLYQQPHVTTVGTATSGMLSDMFGTDLSNKISFTLSNQSYYDTSKNLLEDRGVPATIEIKNSKNDLVNQIDPVLIKSLTILKEK